MAKEVEGQASDINAAKLKALQATIDKIEKDYGKGTIMKLGDQPQWDVQVIPSGSVALDHALGTQPEKDLERPSSTRLEARFRYYDLRVKTRSPSPFAWRRIGRAHV